MKSLFLSSILAAVLILQGGCSSSPGGASGRDIGIITGAILGGVAGHQVGDGGDANVVAGAILGGIAGGMAGQKIDERREALERAEAQRQFEYEEEVREQERLEAEMKALEEQKVRDEIARKATMEDVRLAEQEAARVEAELVKKRAAYEESQERARRIQEAQERIRKAQEELAALEAKQ